ncbi:hypothetical protein LUD75_17910 [Epilithonimonas sp. JDS]|uniref:hypothetical protein n=1 Tax=Epilithonimonas sp. JDS TaxID=2902797 RepID=UPI001E37F1DD|nr:hypothetical protein [Epilithonimonas sp. JDS]MCD9856603.1 hypothetical protein [Epilithonimonas sp. JDS]
MENSTNITFQDFLKFVDEVNEEKKKEINLPLYDVCISYVEQSIVSFQKKDWNAFAKEIDKIQEASSQCKSLNDITDILIFERLYGESSKEYCELFTQDIIREFCGKFKSNNFQYIENIIFDKNIDTYKREQALVIYVMIGKQHAEYQLKILNLIERNYKLLNDNQKVICYALFDELLSHSPQANRIKKLFNIKEFSLNYSTENKEIKTSSSSKKWWKFWK